MAKKSKGNSFMSDVGGFFYGPKTVQGFWGPKHEVNSVLPWLTPKRELGLASMSVMPGSTLVKPIVREITSGAHTVGKGLIPYASRAVEPYVAPVSGGIRGGFLRGLSTVVPAGLIGGGMVAANRPSEPKRMLDTGMFPGIVNAAYSALPTPESPAGPQSYWDYLNDPRVKAIVDASLQQQTGPYRRAIVQSKAGTAADIANIGAGYGQESKVSANELAAMQRGHHLAAGEAAHATSASLKDLYGISDELASLTGGESGNTRSQMALNTQASLARTGREQQSAVTAGRERGTASEDMLSQMAAAGQLQAGQATSRAQQAGQQQVGEYQGKIADILAGAPAATAAMAKDIYGTELGSAKTAASMNRPEIQSALKEYASMSNRTVQSPDLSTTSGQVIRLPYINLHDADTATYDALFNQAISSGNASDARTYLSAIKSRSDKLYGKSLKTVKK